METDHQLRILYWRCSIPVKQALPMSRRWNINSGILPVRSGMTTILFEEGFPVGPFQQKIGRAMKKVCGFDQGFNGDIPGAGFVMGKGPLADI